MSSKNAPTKAMTVLDAVWQAHCSSESWNFVTNQLHNGDLYMVLSLIKSFRSIHKNSNPIRFIADSSGKMAILTMFSADLDHCAFVPDLSGINRNEFSEWTSGNGRAEYKPGSLLRLHPQDLLGVEASLAPIAYSRGLFTLMELFKTSLRLPLSVSPLPPMIQEEQSARAATLFSSLGLIRSRTIIMFPYAQTIPFDATPALVAFAARANDLGYKVCTAVHGSEAPIDGTRPINISFDILIPFASLAGHVVSLRSGICDMLSSLDIKKMYLYNADEFLRYESPNAYGLCDVSRSILYAGAGSTATELARYLDEDLYASATDFIPFTVLDFFEKHGTSTGQSVIDSARGCRIGRLRLFPDSVLADGWSELEDWGVWGVGHRSVLYSKPAEVSATAEALFVQLDLAAPGGALHLAIGFDGRTHRLLLDGQRTVAIKLSPAERLLTAHRIIFDAENPRVVTGDDRVLSVGIRKITYVDQTQADVLVQTER